MPAEIVIQFRQGTFSEWAAANPTLSNGEPGYETDTKKWKIGNGSTAWSSLAYQQNLDVNSVLSVGGLTVNTLTVLDTLSISSGGSVVDGIDYEYTMPDGTVLRWSSGLLTAVEEP